MKRKIILCGMILTSCVATYPATVTIINNTDDNILAGIKKRNSRNISPKTSGGLSTIATPITQVTFSRVTGHRTIRGTYKELQKDVQKLAQKYGIFKLSKLREGYPAYIADYIYFTDYNNRLKSKHIYFGPQGNGSATIDVPIIESFTLMLLPEDTIGRFAEGEIKLDEWGHAERIK